MEERRKETRTSISRLSGAEGGKVLSPGSQDTGRIEDMFVGPSGQAGEVGKVGDSMEKVLGASEPRVLKPWLTLGNALLGGASKNLLHIRSSD